MILLTRKVKIQSKNKEKLFELFGKHSTPGLVDKNFTEAEYTGNNSTFRRVYVGGINYFIPLINIKDEGDALNFKFCLPILTKLFLLFLILLGIFSTLYPILVKNLPINFKTLIIFSIPYIVGILFFWWETNNTIKFFKTTLQKD